MQEYNAIASYPIFNGILDSKIDVLQKLNEFGSSYKGNRYALNIQTQTGSPLTFEQLKSLQKDLAKTIETIEINFYRP